MEVKDVLINTSAARIVASTFGVLAGLGGITHGVGEILQGNVAPGGIIVNSWTEGPIATNMGGEPGMTIVPNLLATGILTLIFSLAVLVWAALFVQRKNGGRILIALLVAMLLVAGGTGIVVRQATVYVPGSSGGRVTEMTWGSAGSTWLCGGHHASDSQGAGGSGSGFSLAGSGQGLAGRILGAADGAFDFAHLGHAFGEDERNKLEAGRTVCLEPECYFFEQRPLICYH